MEHGEERDKIIHYAFYSLPYANKLMKTLIITLTLILSANLVASACSTCGCTKKKTDSATKFAKEPSSGKAIQTNAKEQLADRTTDPSFSPEQCAWEKVLAENLGSFYYPHYLKAKERGRITAWDYVKDDPALPRVLIIGDSISRGCTVPVRDALKGKVNLHRAPANCGPTRYGLEKLDIWLGKGDWDLIVFNFGIHDRRTPSKTYTASLEKIIALLNPQTKKLLWLTSTPVPEGANEYVAGSINRLNSVATPLMQKHNIPVIDLHGYILPKLDEYQLPKNCHFKGDGYNYMGAFIAEEVLRQLRHIK